MPEKKRFEDLTKEDLQNLHSIVKPYKIDPKTGKVLRWTGIEKARRHFGVSDETIRNWLEKVPTSPERAPRKLAIKPREEIEFEKTQAWQIIKGTKYEKEIKPKLIHAWQLTGKIDPATFMLNHIEVLREPEFEGRRNPMWTPITRDITPEGAKEIRRFLNLQKAADMHEKLQALTMVKKPGTGKRKEWYLNEDGIHALIDQIEEQDTLIFVAKCLEDGSRPIATAGKKDSRGRPLIPELRFTRDKIDESKAQIRRWETKKGTYAVARFQPETIKLILQYCEDHNIKEGDVLPRTQNIYSDRIISALKNAKIYKKGIGAYILRHTFATQALKHLCDLDSVSYQGAWETTDIIKTYYAGLDEEKLDYQFQGIKPTKNIPWNSWIEQFTRHFKDRYEYLKTFKKPSLRINWKSIEAIVSSTKTKPAQREAMKKGLDLHRQGVSDEEIKAKLGWK